MNLISSWWPLFSILAAFAEESRTIRSVAWEVTLVGHEDRQISRKFIAREYVFEATPRDGGEPWHVRVGGEFLEAREPIEEIRLFQDRLIVTTFTKIIVVDLGTGATVKLLLSRGSVFSPSGKRIAFVEWQVRATLPQFSGTVVSVLDLESLTVRPVFPEPESIGSSWPVTGDPFEVHHLDRGSPPDKKCHGVKLHWSEDSTRLSFLCTHYLTADGRIPASNDQMAYSAVVVFLQSDLEDSSFVRFALPRESFVLPEVDELPNRGSLLSDTGMKWHDDRLLEIRMGARWSPDRIFLDIETGQIRNDPGTVEE